MCRDLAEWSEAAVSGREMESGAGKSGVIRPSRTTPTGGHGNDLGWVDDHPPNGRPQVVCPKSEDEERDRDDRNDVPVKW